MRDEDEDNSLVKYGLAILTKESNQIVKWDQPEERAAFMQERVRIARAAVPQ